MNWVLQKMDRLYVNQAICMAIQVGDRNKGRDSQMTRDLGLCCTKIGDCLRTPEDGFEKSGSLGPARRQTAMTGSEGATLA